MYKIIGTDGKEYGPVSADQLRRWISEGRVNAHTRAQAEGSTEWRPISSFPEFAPSLPEIPPVSPGPGPGGLPPTLPVRSEFQPTGLPADLLQRNHDFDVFSCFGRSWELLKNNFGLIAGACALMLLIQFFMGLLGIIPIVGVLVSLASIVIGGPLLGGFYYLILRVMRGQPAEIGNLFDGFRLRFLQLFLVILISFLLTVAVLIPGAVLVVIAVFASVRGQAVNAVAIIFGVVGFFLMIIPILYLSISWIFAIPLVMDKDLEFWQAMEASRKVTARVWLKTFVLMLLVGILYLVGMIPCGLGLFITIPLGYGALMYAYEDLFSDRQTPNA